VRATLEALVHPADSNRTLSPHREVDRRAPANSATVREIVRKVQPTNAWMATSGVAVISDCTSGVQNLSNHSTDALIIVVGEVAPQKCLVGDTDIVIQEQDYVAACF
jgi:hypothetical protein